MTSDVDAAYEDFRRKPRWFRLLSALVGYCVLQLLWNEYGIARFRQRTENPDPDAYSLNQIFETLQGAQVAGLMWMTPGLALCLLVLVAGLFRTGPFMMGFLVLIALPTLWLPAQLFLSEIEPTPGTGTLLAAVNLMAIVACLQAYWRDCETGMRFRDAVAIFRSR